MPRPAAPDGAGIDRGGLRTRADTPHPRRCRGTPSPAPRGRGGRGVRGPHTGQARLPPTGTRAVDAVPAGHGQATGPHASRPVGATRASPSRAAGAGIELRCHRARWDTPHPRLAPLATPSPTIAWERGAGVRGLQRVPRPAAPEGAGSEPWCHDARSNTPHPRLAPLATPSPAPRGRGGRGVRGLQHVPRLSTPESVGTGSVSRASRPGGSGTPDPYGELRGCSRHRDRRPITVGTPSPPCNPVGARRASPARAERRGCVVRSRPCGPDPYRGRRWVISGRWVVRVPPSRTRPTP